MSLYAQFTGVREVKIIIHQIKFPLAKGDEHGGHTQANRSTEACSQGLQRTF